MAFWSFNQTLTSLGTSIFKNDHVLMFLHLSTSQHFTEQMEDFSNELFSSFFDEQLLTERTPLLDMELESQNPDIQQEHSYSLSGDSAPQSPSMPIKSDEDIGGVQAHVYKCQTHH